MTRISYERGAELRGRMVEAADEFTLAVSAARQRMRTASGEVRRHPRTPLMDPETERPTTAFQTELDEVNDRLDDVIGKLARVQLLFGVQTDTGIAAEGVLATSRTRYAMENSYPATSETSTARSRASEPSISRA